MRISLPKLQSGPWLFAAAPAATLLIVVFVLPFVTLALMSLHKNLGLGETEPGYTIENYIAFVTDPFYLGILVRTLLIGLIVTITSAILAFPISYFLARTRSRFRGLLIFLAVAPLFVSLVIRNLGLMPVLSEEGLVNWGMKSLGIISVSLPLLHNTVGVVIGLIYSLLPIFILALTVTIQRIDPNLELAASGLGARPWYTFFRVLLPLSVPGLVSGSLLVFPIAISAYTTPVMLGGNRVFVMATYISQQILTVLNYPFGSTCAVILLLVASALAAVSRRVPLRVGA
jgi:putative spermidine/putrescine transport system permease protein